MQLQDMNDQKRVFISMIVPVYNVEPYIKECFDSIAAQTYEGRMECIFVDDCGQDDSMALLSECVGSYEGPIEISIVHHDRNRGLSAARNTGIDKAKGDYLFFIDSDDTITPDCIQKLAEQVHKHLGGVDVVCGSTLSNGHRFLEMMRKWWLKSYYDNQKMIKRLMLLRTTVSMVAWNKLIRKSLVVDNNVYFAEGLVHEDELWNFFMAKHVSSLAIVRDVTYLYRKRDGSIMSKSVSPLRYMPIVNIMLDNMSRPCLASEVVCILSLCESYDFVPLITSLFERYKFTRKVFDARLRTFDYSIFSVKGFIRQVVYRWYVLLCYIANGDDSADG